MKAKTQFKAVPAGEFHPVTYEPGDEVPPELEATARHFESFAAGAPAAAEAAAAEAAAAEAAAAEAAAAEAAAADAATKKPAGRGKAGAAAAQE